MPEGMNVEISHKLTEQEEGAVVYLDPDGRGVVYAPWIFGRDPDPTDRYCSSGTPSGE